MIQLNVQPKERKTDRSDGALDIIEIFLTIQGEGPLVGSPAIFIRLAGCDLQCPACDTNYTRGRAVLSLYEIINQIRKLTTTKFKPLIVLTGGEPFRQPCGPLIRALRLEGYTVQVETNGTLYDESLFDLRVRQHNSGIMVVCSPKTGSISPDLADDIYALKYILKAGEVDPTDGLPLSSLLSGVVPAKPWPGFMGVVYVQPCDEQDPVANRANMMAAVESCMTFGHKLCLQMHKIVGLP